MTMELSYHNATSTSLLLVLAQPIPIAHLPLRRSTAALLRACGYNNVKEVYDSIASHHQQQQRIAGNDETEGSGIMNLVMEFRHYRSNIESSGTTGSNGGRNNVESAMNDATSTVTKATSEELLFAQNVIHELMDAVSIVTQDDNAPVHCRSTGKYQILGESSHLPPMISSTAKTAADLLRIHQNVIGGNRSSSNTNIITFCRALDELLDGGIAIGELTELAGSPGSGKTTMCIQLAVNAALPYYCGGVNGRTVYIDTEGSFAPERAYDLASHLIQHVQTGLRRKQRQSINNNISNRSGGKTTTTSNINAPQQQFEWNVTAEDILNNILVYRAHDVADLSAIIHGALPALLATSSSCSSSSNGSGNKSELPIRLVIIDSIAFPYRAVASPSLMGESLSALQLSSSATTMDYATRTQHLTTTAATLTSLAVKYQVAVVAVNQMTTKFAKDEVMVNENDLNIANANATSDSSTVPRTKLIPALGESWAHAVTSRLILSKPKSYSNYNDVDVQNDQQQQQHYYRTCSLTKSPRLPNGEANLIITNAGIRGTEYLDAMKTKRARTSSCQ